MPDLSPNETPYSQAAMKMLEEAKEMQEKPKDAIDMLKLEHKEALALYDKFSDAETPTQKQLCAAEICLALSLHMRIEEECFYPAVAEALERTEKGKDKDELIVPEARLEHESLKKLIGELEGMGEGADFDAHVQVMSEYTKHHAKEEEGTMFPRAKSADLDLDGLGRELLELKVRLLEHICESPEEAAMPSGLYEGVRSTGAGLRVADRP